MTVSCPYKHDPRASCPNCATWPRDAEGNMLDLATCSAKEFSERLDGTFPVPTDETYEAMAAAAGIPSRVLFHMPAPWQPSESQMLGTEVKAGVALPRGVQFAEPRPPVAPGVLIEDDEARVHVSREVLRIVGRWAGALALVAAGAAVMYAEGQRQAMPGPGFAIGLSLIVGAAFLVARERAE